FFVLRPAASHGTSTLSLHDALPIYHFLVTTLHGAVTFCQIDCVTLTVSQHLNFDVAWVFQVFFHVHHVITESRFRFRFGHGDGLRQFSIAAYNAHTATAAAPGRFDDHRVPHPFSLG